MKRKFRIISGVLCVLMIASFANFNIIAQNSFGIVEDNTVREETENIYNKIHFYFGEKEHNIIDNLDELTSATELLIKSNCDDRAYNANNKEVQMTVQFESDFMETEKYKSFSEERKNLK